MSAQQETHPIIVAKIEPVITAKPIAQEIKTEEIKTLV
jgi:hypothetical protein